MHRLALTLVAVLAAAAPVAAGQTVAEKIARAVDIPPEEWRAMAMGRTLTYRIDGEFWAMEHYTPGTDRVTLQFHDGTCIKGTWDYQAPHYCFHWEGQGTSCFRHARLDDEILVIETLSGQDTGAIQTMTAVTDTPVACGPMVTS